MDCGPLSLPKNGNLVLSSGTTFTSTATYSCTPPFQLLGAAVRVCQGTGVWSGEPPTCHSLNCPNLTSPDDGSVSQTGSVPGSVAAYSCSDGFTLVGAETVTCLENGFWSNAPPKCRCKGTVKQITVRQHFFFVVL